MQIIDFRAEHAKEARQIAKQSLEIERAVLPILPEAEIPELEFFADIGFGVAAVDGGEVVGYWCPYPPRENAFWTEAFGVYSPLHANGVMHSKRLNRGEIYSRLYQAAAEKWLAAGVRYHSVTVYAQDEEFIGALFDNNFGKRWVDAICGCAGTVPINEDIRELAKGESRKIRELRRGLAEHLTKSPCFMADTPESWYEEAERRASRIFVIEKNGGIAAYIEVGGKGENFLSASEGMMNICGAYCKPEYRGNGLMTGLVDHVRGVLSAEGYSRLGVDYESINPTALRFWRKRFLPYTFGLTRRLG